MKAHYLDDHTPLSSSELDAEGVHHRCLSLDQSVHGPALDALMSERGYVERDEVALSPETPELETICAKFDREHLHTEDEVRFVLEGGGIFDIRDRRDRPMRIQVGPGDLLVVPKDRYHRFELDAGGAIRCIRLFQDPSGWVPHYR